MDTPRTPRKMGRPLGAKSGPRGKTPLILSLLRAGHIPAEVARVVGVTIQAVCYARDAWPDWTPPPPPQTSAAA